MSRPWMKFYPADWQADPAVRSCSLAARGLWVEMLCIMQKSEPVGRLTVNGRALSNAALAPLSASTLSQVNKCLAELEAAGVFSRDESGVIYSRRMVRDEERAEQHAQNGRKGGNPRLKAGVNPPVKPGVEQGVKAQSPEARVQKEEDAREPRLSDEIVDRIWSDAPPKARERSSKADVRRTLAAALKRGGDFEQISRALSAYWWSDDASKSDGAYAKGIHRMIEGDRWKDWDTASPSQSSTAAAPVDWAFRAGQWKAQRMWLGAWGPTPLEKGCLCPPELLEAAS